MFQLLNIPEPIDRNKKIDQIIADTSLIKLVTKAIDEQREIFQNEVEVLLPRPMILRVSLFFEKKQEPQSIGMIIPASEINESVFKVTKTSSPNLWLLFWLFLLLVLILLLLLIIVAFRRR